MLFKLANLIVIVTTLTLTLAKSDYWTKREQLINKELTHMLGSDIVLNEKEQEVNKILMNYKLKEYDYGFTHPGKFAASKHFFEAKEEIDQSEVFKIIRKLPKGGSLHGHDTSLASHEFLFNLTYSDNLYACVQNDTVLLEFKPSKESNDSCNWELVKKLRETTNIDDLILKSITLFVKNPKDVYTDINIVWHKFQSIFRTVTPMITYKPIWKLYFYETLRELYNDNVMYIEVRSTLPNLYDLEGNTYGPIEVVATYKEILDKFMKEYPDFQGGRVIYAPQRLANNSTMENYVATYKKLKKTYPNLVAGFDLVGQEDSGRPLADFIEELQELSSLGTKFFFHAGETNWYGSPTDLNLVDAILLGTTRIGHGYALFKHPEVLRQVKERGIGIEVNPISNQVLLLVDDLRNHPASYFIANNYPIVISNDDPGFWGATGLSYDWYMAFMGMAGRNADLKFLKQLALNSLKYSSLEGQEKEAVIKNWKIRWDNFIDSVLEIQKLDLTERNTVDRFN